MILHEAVTLHSTENCQNSEIFDFKNVQASL